MYKSSLVGTSSRCKAATPKTSMKKSSSGSSVASWCCTVAPEWFGEAPQAAQTTGCLTGLGPKDECWLVLDMIEVVVNRG